MIMDEDQWMYDNIRSEEVDMNEQNEDKVGVNEEHVDCFDMFNTSQVRSVAYKIGFVVVIMRSNTNNVTGSRKCGCPFKLHGKPVVGGEGWMMKLICGSHNHELVKSFVGHPYAGRLTKAKCKILIGQGNLVDCPSKQEFDECLKKFEFVCLSWLMFANYVMHLGNTTTNKYENSKFLLLLGFTIEWIKIIVFVYLVVYFICRIEFVHWALNKLLPNSLRDLCSVWEAMNNMITLQHTKIKASFETSTHVVGHIVAEFERVHYAGKNPSCCGCIMKTTHGFPYACELARYVVSTISLETIHMFWRRLSFSDQGLFEPKVSITEEMKIISKRFEELDVCGKEIAYPDLNFMCAPPKNVKTKRCSEETDDQETKINKARSILLGNSNSSVKRSTSSSEQPIQRRTMPMLMHYIQRRTKQQRSTKCDSSYWEYVDALHSMQNSNSSVKHSASSSEQPIQRRAMLMLDQFHSCIHDSIENIVDVNDNGNCGYCAIAALLELTKWSDEYINLLGGIDRFEELNQSLLVDGLSMMNITNMGYVIASRYNVILVSLSIQKSMKFFPLRSQPPTDSSVHCVICIGHVFLRDHCSSPSLALLWSTHCKVVAHAVLFDASFKFSYICTSAEAPHV
ncbi:hypothetical protein HKD37_01G000718 [Glycine soja]